MHENVHSVVSYLSNCFVNVVSFLFGKLHGIVIVSDFCIFPQLTTFLAAQRNDKLLPLKEKTFIKIANEVTIDTTAHYKHNLYIPGFKYQRW